MKYFPTLSLISMEMIELLLTNNYNAATHLITLIYTPVRVQFREDPPPPRPQLSIGHYRQKPLPSPHLTTPFKITKTCDDKI